MRGIFVPAGDVDFPVKPFDADLPERPFEADMPVTRTRAGIRRAAASLAVLLALATAACGAAGPDPVAEEVEGMKADRVLFGTETFLTTEGIKRGVVRADTAFMYDPENRVELRNVELTTFDENGRETATITANQGEFDTATRKMVARGDVVVLMADGRRIETFVLNYDPRTDRIWSDTESWLYRDGTRLRGDGFTSNADMTNLKVRNPTGRAEGLELEF